MKTIILLLANIMLISSANASTGSEIANAEVGQLLSLKNDLILNEGIHGKTLSSKTMRLPTEKGNQVEVEVSCGLYRKESPIQGSGASCPGYRKTKVSKDKPIMIRIVENDSRRIFINSSQVKNRCEFSLVLSCQIIFESGHNFLPSMSALMLKEALEQAADLVNVEEDTSEPTPWP